LSPRQVYKDQLKLKKKSEVEMVIQQCEVVIIMQKYIRKWLVMHAYLKLLSAIIFTQCYWRQKFIKRKSWRLKQDQLKLKIESKANRTNKQCEIMSLKTENKKSLKERIRKERKGLDLANGGKKRLIEAKNGEKKIRMRKKRECRTYRYAWVSIQKKKWDQECLFF